MCVILLYDPDHAGVRDNADSRRIGDSGDVAADNFNRFRMSHVLAGNCHDAAWIKKNVV
jgi:hypothetical protein